jgi:hypothetical protein
MTRLNTGKNAVIGTPQSGPLKQKTASHFRYLALKKAVRMADTKLTTRNTSEEKVPNDHGAAGKRDICSIIKSQQKLP